MAASTRILALIALPAVMAAGSAKSQVYSDSPPTCPLTRPGPAVSTPDSRLVVMDLGQACVIVFDSIGRVERVFGRRGDGPGDLRSPNAMGLKQDTLWIADAQLLRVSFFSLDGNLLRTEAAAADVDRSSAYRPSVPAALLADGTTLVRISVSASQAAAGPAPVPIPIVRRAADGRVMDTLLVLWSDDEVMAIRPLADGRGMYRRQPFRDGPLFDASSDGRWLATAKWKSGQATIALARERTSDGTRSSIAVPFRAMPIEARVVDSVLRGIAGELVAAKMYRTEADAYSAAKANIKLPRSHPPASGMVVGTDGTAWMDQPSKKGQWIGWGRATSDTIQGPSGAFLLEANARFLWFAEYDEDGVPRIIRQARPANGNGA